MKERYCDTFDFSNSKTPTRHNSDEWGPRSTDSDGSIDSAPDAHRSTGTNKDSILADLEGRVDCLEEDVEIAKEYLTYLMKNDLTWLEMRKRAVQASRAKESG